MVLKPGESTIIESAVFMMHEGMDGPHNFGVHLKTNDPATGDRTRAATSQPQTSTIFDVSADPQ